MNSTERPPHAAVDWLEARRGQREHGEYADSLGISPSQWANLRSGAREITRDTAAVILSRLPKPERRAFLAAYDTDLEARAASLVAG